MAWKHTNKTTRGENVYKSSDGEENSGERAGREVPREAEAPGGTGISGASPTEGIFRVERKRSKKARAEETRREERKDEAG